MYLRSTLQTLKRKGKEAFTRERSGKILKITRNQPVMESLISKVSACNLYRHLLRFQLNLKILHVVLFIEALTDN